MNRFKEKLKAGQKLIGFEVDLADPCIAEMAAMQGYDFLWIDTEHEAMDYETVLMQIIACHSGGAASLVRIPWNEPYLAKRVLEMGPDGIIFPMVNSAEEAKQAMDSCVYPPHGKRGFGPRRACGYCGEDLFAFIERANDSMCRFVQVEHVDAVNNLDEILRIPFLDGLILGPCDLSGSIGLLNDIYHPDVMALIDKTAAKCNAAGMPLGIAVGANSTEQIRFWLDKGCQFICSGADMSELVTIMKRREQMMRAALDK